MDTEVGVGRSRSELVGGRSGAGRGRAGQGGAGPPEQGGVAEPVGVGRRRRPLEEDGRGAVYDFFRVALAVNA